MQIAFNRSENVALRCQTGLTVAHHNRSTIVDRVRTHLIVIIFKNEDADVRHCWPLLVDSIGAAAGRK